MSTATYWTVCALALTLGLLGVGYACAEDLEAAKARAGARFAEASGVGGTGREAVDAGEGTAKAAGRSRLLRTSAARPVRDAQEVPAPAAEGSPADSRGLLRKAVDGVGRYASEVAWGFADCLFGGPVGEGAVLVGEIGGSALGLAVGAATGTTVANTLGGAFIGYFVGKAAGAAAGAVVAVAVCGSVSVVSSLGG